MLSITSPPVVDDVAQLRQRRASDGLRLPIVAVRAPTALAPRPHLTCIKHQCRNRRPDPLPSGYCSPYCDQHAPIASYGRSHGNGSERDDGDDGRLAVDVRPLSSSSSPRSAGTGRNPLSGALHPLIAILQHSRPSLSPYLAAMAAPTPLIRVEGLPAPDLSTTTCPDVHDHAPIVDVVVLRHAGEVPNEYQTVTLCLSGQKALRSVALAYRRSTTDAPITHVAVCHDERWCPFGFEFVRWASSPAPANLNPGQVPGVFLVVRRDRTCPVLTTLGVVCGGAAATTDLPAGLDVVGQCTSDLDPTGNFTQDAATLNAWAQSAACDQRYLALWFDTKAMVHSTLRLCNGASDLEVRAVVCLLSFAYVTDVEISAASLSILLKLEQQLFASNAALCNQAVCILSKLGVTMASRSSPWAPVAQQCQSLVAKLIRHHASAISLATFLTAVDALVGSPPTRPRTDAIASLVQQCGVEQATRDPRIVADIVIDLVQLRDSEASPEWPSQCQAFADRWFTSDRSKRAAGLLLACSRVASHPGSDAASVTTCLMIVQQCLSSIRNIDDDIVIGVVVRKQVVPCVVEATISDLAFATPGVFAFALDVVDRVLWKQHRRSLLDAIGATFKAIFIPLLNARQLPVAGDDAGSRLDLLETIASMLNSPAAIFDFFVAFDCNGDPLFQDLCRGLGRQTRGRLLSRDSIGAVCLLVNLVEIMLAQLCADPPDTSSSARLRRQRSSLQDPAAVAQKQIPFAMQPTIVEENAPTNAAGAAPPQEPRLRHHRVSTWRMRYNVARKRDELIQEAERALVEGRVDDAVALMMEVGGGLFNESYTTAARFLWSAARHLGENDAPLAKQIRGDVTEYIATSLIQHENKRMMDALMRTLDLTQSHGSLLVVFAGFAHDGCLDVPELGHTWLAPILDLFGAAFRQQHPSSVPRSVNITALLLELLRLNRDLEQGAIDRMTPSVLGRALRAAGIRTLPAQLEQQYAQELSAGVLSRTASVVHPLQDPKSGPGKGRSSCVPWGRHRPATDEVAVDEPRHDDDADAGAVRRQMLLQWRARAAEPRDVTWPSSPALSRPMIAELFSLLWPSASALLRETGRAVVNDHRTQVQVLLICLEGILMAFGVGVIVGVDRKLLDQCRDDAISLLAAFCNDPTRSVSMEPPPPPATQLQALFDAMMTSSPDDVRAAVDVQFRAMSAEVTNRHDIRTLVRVEKDIGCFKLTEPGAPRRLVHRGRVLAAFPAHRSEQAVQDAIDAHPADNRQTWRRSMAFLLSDCLIVTDGRGGRAVLFALASSSILAHRSGTFVEVRSARQTVVLTRYSASDDTQLWVDALRETAASAGQAWRARFKNRGQPVQAAGRRPPSCQICLEKFGTRALFSKPRQCTNCQAVACGQCYGRRAAACANCMFQMRPEAQLIS